MNNLPTIPPPARTDRAYTARMHELLARNDREGWTRDFANDVVWRRGPHSERSTVREWIEDHIVHAIEHCPDIVELWGEKERVPGYQRHRHVTDTMRFIAQALEGLDEEAKIRLLDGRGEGKAQQQLYAHLASGTSSPRWTKVCSPAPRWTKVCSPAWVGEPGNALRRAAEGLGWKVEYLPWQVSRFIAEPLAQEWACRMPYPHSVAVLAWVDEALKSSTQRPGGARIVQSQPWADAKDIALSQLLCAYATVELKHAWQAHPDVPSISSQEARELLSVVKMHASLGMWQELGEAVVAGNVLDCIAPQTAYPLPDLDGPTTM